MRTQSQLSYNMQQTIQWVYSHLSLFSISDFAIMICSIVSSCYWNHFNNDRFTSPYLRALPVSTNHCSMCYQSSFATLYEVTNHITGMLYCFVWDHCTPIRVLLLCSWDDHTCLVHKHEFKPEEYIVWTWEKQLEMSWFRN